MTNTQAALIREALALIHGELISIRTILERNELAANGEAMSSGVPAAVDVPAPSPTASAARGRKAGRK